MAAGLMVVIMVAGLRMRMMRMRRMRIVAGLRMMRMVRMVVKGMRMVVRMAGGKFYRPL
jgi:hypothetical protein